MAIAVVLVGHVLTAVAWNSVFTIDFAWDKPPRGVGTPEIVAGLMSATLPALLVPTLSQDRRGGTRARVLAVSCCVAAILATLGILVTWGITLGFTTSPGNHPAVHHLIGNLAFISGLGWFSVLLLGRAAGQVASLVLTCSFLIFQQRWPNAPIAEWFSTGDRWHTNWPLTLLALATTFAFVWTTSGIPLLDKAVDSAQ